MKHKKPAANINELAVSRTDIHFIKPSLIEPDTFSFLGSETEERFNIREDFGESLVPSIKRNIEQHGPNYGIELPVLGYFDTETGMFKLTDGERRWRNALEVENEGIEIYVPCKRHPKHYSMTSRLLDTLTCATGKPLTMMEQARGMSRLVALEVTPRDIANARNCSTTHVKTCLALIALPWQLTKALQKEEMSATLAIDINTELKLNPELDLDWIMRAGREARDAAEASHITAKHLPLLVGKAAFAARMNNPANHPDASESRSHAITPAESQADAQSGAGERSSAATVPFVDVDSTPGHGETNEDGEFIGGVTTTKWVFGKVKAEVRTAFREKFFFGIFLGYPGDYPDGRINQRPTVHGVGFESIEEASLAGIQQIRFEVSLLSPDKMFATFALTLIDKQIEEMTKGAPASEPEPAAPEPLQPLVPDQFPDNRKLEQTALVDQTPLEVLVGIQEPLQRKICELTRYDTLTLIIKLLKGKATPLDVTKYVMGITD